MPDYFDTREDDLRQRKQRLRGHMTLVLTLLGAACLVVVTGLASLAA